MSIKDYDTDDINNGPRHHEPITAGALKDVGSDVGAAFALGRELYKQGRSSSYLSTLKKHKTKAWGESLRKGYAWQRARA